MPTQRLSSASARDPGRDAVFSLEISRRGALALVKVTGRVDTGSVHLLIELVEHLTRDRLLRLVLDMARATSLSAHGLTALLQVQQAVAEVGGQLLLRDPSPVVRYLLAVSGVLRQFDLESTFRRCPEPVGGAGTSLGGKPGHQCPEKRGTRIRRHEALSLRHDAPSVVVDSA
ncbi:STAS domain-containing protein [Plantactinospora sp. KLBMP9567]|uniref:STAS domain-containing protein n=1 Tax=Plantactinospora sp. KLBMP9567 TaxID=3085900 RepID=UPI00298291FF|nr:STAS domain-containing protein [Plantactinospora sp. KLBMP9567]MDW5322337.1 STAS domain-containing protein [Plantactinospora sp. KLBMP9567]